MSKFTKEIVDDLAAKLLISLNDEENKMVLDEFEIIDETINMINKIDNIENVDIMSHALDDFSYELRADEEVDSVAIDDLLKNCDQVIDREVVVPKVVM